MSGLIGLGALVAAGLLSAVLPQATLARASHVIVISIDGLGPDAYLTQPPPTLGAVMARGSHARRLVSVFPSLTYPAHASMATGAWPSEHGVASNYDDAGGFLSRADDMQAKPLWEAVGEAGLVTAIVTWPLSVGAKVDYRVPEILDFAHGVTKGQLRQASTPSLARWLDDKAMASDLPPFSHPEAGLRYDSMTEALAGKIIREKKPNLLFLHFLDYDHRQHLHGPDSREADAALRRIDQRVGALLAAAKAAGTLADTAILILGDHGFTPVHSALSLPSLMALEASDEGDESAGYKTIFARASVAFYGARLEGLEARFRALAQRRFNGLFEVLSPDRLAETNGFPGAAFALVAQQGYVFTESKTRAAVVPALPFRGAHGYLPDSPAMAAGLLVAGPGIKQGVVLPVVRMVDIAPTIAAMLGVCFPTPSGQVIAGLFDEPVC
ncbi:MAG: alkaline phosphatase family protein [Pseudomonadota bacterium]